MANRTRMAMKRILRGQRSRLVVGTAMILVLDEQDTSSAWQEATPTVAKISSRPMNLRRKSGMTANRLVIGDAFTIARRYWRSAVPAPGRALFPGRTAILPAR